jgi:hypothetical protein
MAKWSIPLMERHTADDAVIVAHWRVTEEDGDHSASASGTCSFEPNIARSDFTPYVELTEEMVLDWCWQGGVDKEATEASLTADIEEQKNPTTESGIPWE